MRLKTVILLACLCVLTSCAEVAYAQTAGPAIGNITSAGSSCSTTSTPTNCVSLHLDGKTGAATVQVSNTFVGTGQFEVSNDNGTTWAAINGTPPNSTTAVTSTTATGLWQFNVAGFTDIRVRCSAYTSGTLSVNINAAQVSAKSGGGTSLPALSDNGTNVVSTEPFSLPASSGGNGSLVPTLKLTGSLTTGIGFASSTQTDIIFGGTRFVSFFSPGTSAIALGSAAHFGWSSSTDPAGSGLDTILRRRGAANVQLGAVDLNGTPVDQTISVQNAITGSNLPGGHFTIDAPVGTGLGAGSKTCLNRALMGATGTTAQSATNGFCVGESKTLSNTTATTTALANISVPSNSSGGSSGSINVSCNDGTNFDSETVSFVVSYVNKATALTIGTVQLTTASTANNSGSCTTAVTATAGTNSVNINVTPVITTIVPTTVTGTILSLSSYATGNVTIN